ncbi:MAG TPA: SDR family oxidoreductase [Trebonia sp.]|nr:SDR family oxidoreductase [Trebonia sp.]
MAGGRALVVGVTGGIGAEVTRLLESGGTCVHGIDDRVAPQAGHRWTVDIAQAGGQAFASWLHDYLERNGVPDMFAWCAGLYDRTDLADYGMSRLQTMLDANLTAFLLACRALLAARRRSPRPLRMAVVGSQAGVTGGRDAVYAAAKAGCVAAVKSIAREYARSGVQANVVSPGPTRTPMNSVMGERQAYYENAIPAGRFNTAEEVASVVVWLLTTAPLTINGATMDVDGGLVRR